MTRPSIGLPCFLRDAYERRSRQYLRGTEARIAIAWTVSSMTSWRFVGEMDLISEMFSQIATNVLTACCVECLSLVKGVQAICFAPFGVLGPVSYHLILPNPK